MLVIIGKQLVEKQDTFTEKLITQIIKNLQVKISNIHIRYEDDVSILIDDLNVLIYLYIAVCETCSVMVNEGTH